MSKRKLEATRANQARKSGARVPPGSNLPKRRQAQRMRWGLYAFGAAGFVGLAIAIFLISSGGSSSASPKTDFNWSGLPGLQTVSAPWTQGLDQYDARLHAIGFKPLPQETLNYHIHSHLDLWVNGKKIQVPADVGINQLDNPAEFASLHTHDTTGVMHVEAPKKGDYTLGQFFGVWGVKLTPSCLGIYCNSGDKTVRAWVNGKPVSDPFHLVIVPHQEIVVTYGTQAQVPKTIPAKYKFAAGL
jgi:hypothetical protein